MFRLIFSILINHQFLCRQMDIFRLFFLTLMLVYSCALPAANLAHADSNLPDHGTYRLGSGDVLTISVYGEAELTGIYPIQDNGRITFPLVGDIALNDLTLAQGRDVLTQKLSDGYLIAPDVQIAIENFRPFYILGEVKTPGGYPYSAEMSAMNAVAMAGGFTYRAKQNSILLKRRQDDGTHIEMPIDADASIMPGDILTVKERFF